MQKIITLAAWQHSLAVLALTAAIGALQRFSPPPELEAHHKATLALIESCAKSTRKKRLSQGAGRSLDDACAILAPWLEDYKELHPDICFFRFACACWCALTLVEDVINICPSISAGEHRKSWHGLCRQLSELCAGLQELEADIAMAGSDLYECVIDALIGKRELVPTKNMAHAFVSHKAA